MQQNKINKQALEAPNVPVPVSKINKPNKFESQRQQNQPRRANNTSYTSFPTDKGKDTSLFQVLTEEQLKNMDDCIVCESVGIFRNNVSGAHFAGFAMPPTQGDQLRSAGTPLDGDISPEKEQE